SPGSSSQFNRSHRIFVRTGNNKEFGSHGQNHNGLG
ncbi:hypothetical protein RF55_17106, partial [Lasius niger]